MDEIEDDAIVRNPPNPYVVSYPHNHNHNHNLGYGYQQHHLRNSPYSHQVTNDVDGNRLIGKDDVVDDADVYRNRSGQISMKVDEDDDMDRFDDENDDDEQQKSEKYGYLKHPMRISPYFQSFGHGSNNNEDEEDEERLPEERDGEDDDDDDEGNTTQFSLKHVDEEDDKVVGENDDDNNNDDDNDDYNDDNEKSYAIRTEDGLEWQWHPKKQKVKSLISTYEFAARVPEPSVGAYSASNSSFGVRNSSAEWTERDTFVLLDEWGDRFLQRERKSLRAEDWQKVAEKVSEVSNIERTGTQCRNRLDTLKKKYKKDKIKFPEKGGGDEKWVYFKKMDNLMSSPQQRTGISCGSDSRESAFMNPRVDVNHANGLEDMKNSPENTEFIRTEGLEETRTKKRRKGRGNSKASSFKLLADSIHNFGKIYEKIENNRREQIMELEKMRMNFLRELETQQRQIFERLQSEIPKLNQRDD